MSASLYFEPVKETKGTHLPDELKYILKNIFELEDGPAILDSSNISYLKGVGDGNEKIRPYVLRMISAIERHGKIQIYLSY